MDYDIFKDLRVKEDDLHIHTKSQFCINLIKGLNEELSDNHIPNSYFNSNQRIISKSNDSINRNKEELISYPNDRKNLDMKTRLKYLLFPDDNQKMIQEDLDSEGKNKVINNLDFFICYFFSILNFSIKDSKTLKNW